MKGFFNRIWANYAIDKILYVRKGVFLVRFVHLQDKNAVEKRGCYFFDSKPMLGTQSLSKIGSILGIPLKTDKFTKDKQVIRYARLLIEMPIEGPFPDHIEFFNEEGILIRQLVTYEWIPSKCTHCAMLGHTEEVCKKKRIICTEWRQVLKSQTPTQTSKDQSKEDKSSKEVHFDVFTTVTRGRSPKKATAIPSSPSADHPNQFNVLMEDQILELNNIGLIGLLETKVKRQNHGNPVSTESISWRCQTNTFIAKLTRSPPVSIFILHSSMATTRNFKGSPYGRDAWCILGDFNAVLSKDDRIGGNEVTYHDIQELSSFMEACEVLEMPSSGAFFTWTNKSIWSRIDRVFINTKYLPLGLSDHSPILIHSHAALKPPPQFQFCDMWCSHKNFHDIVSAGFPDPHRHDIMNQARAYFERLRRQLRQLNRSHFADLKSQWEKAHTALHHLQRELQLSPDDVSLQSSVEEATSNYISILSSSLALLKQQCKIDWIKYGDDCTRFFFARAKQRKLAAYIYAIQDATGAKVEGFDQLKNMEELGIKDYTAWNKATVAKLVWTIATKQDSLWVKWVHVRYIRHNDWWDYSPPADCSWTWKKICAMKDIFKAGCPTPHIWTFQGTDRYKVRNGYQWLIGGNMVPWGKVSWARASIPRHAFIAWVYVQHQLPTKMRLARFIPRSDLLCALCTNAAEDDTHLFSDCPYAVEVWNSLSLWWLLPFHNPGRLHEDMTASLTAFKAPKAHKQITFAKSTRLQEPQDLGCTNR
ncbi:hypothetical protein Cgig2_022175 [Carnegiea gigantea]|uniref:Reverse transcriptase zinc-binding domain-containing protein n=1 Tax=Carnegiea gigantea TaxID=171969 RepID=A0A9Q1JIF4_9CARY|nr:hypothetical protein Cgig2_022175 [Carnegiea gigantea]